MKYIKQFLKYFDAFPTFTSRDVRLFLQKNGAGSDYHKIFMHNMIKNGKVFLIKRGRYTLHDDPMVAGFIFSPFYYGMATALTHYKLWDYVTPISIITTMRVRKSSIELLGRNATVRRVHKDKFFGYTMVQYTDNLYIPMADIEKTLIDSVYLRARFSNEVYTNIKKNIDRKKLAKYLKHYNITIKKQVIDIINM